MSIIQRSYFDVQSGEQPNQQYFNRFRPPETYPKKANFLAALTFYLHSVFTTCAKYSPPLSFAPTPFHCFYHATESKEQADTPWSLLSQPYHIVPQHFMVAIGKSGINEHGDAILCASMFVQRNGRSGYLTPTNNSTDALNFDSFVP